MAYFGEGKGPIHVDNVKCTGNERSLADCIKQDIGKHNCRHSEDAGVICDYLSKKSSGNSNKGKMGNVPVNAGKRRKGGFRKTGVAGNCPRL